MSDPLDELRKDWASLQPPSATDAEPDAATRESIEWALAAWRTLEPPAAQPPAARPPAAQIAGRPVVSRRRVLPFLVTPVAAAAAALLVWFVLGRTGQPARPSDSELARTHVDQPEQAHAPAQESFSARALTDGSVELTRGRVRLILFDETKETQE